MGLLLILIFLSIARVDRFFHLNSEFKIHNSKFPL